ncbi:hypothetical protein T484DRAFT_1777984, partial [Baffinella frigidus]
ESWESSAPRRDGWAHGMTHITELSVANNRLSEMPNGIGRIHCLTDFDMSNNELEMLPDSMGLLTALTKLNLTNNQLHSVPNTLMFLLKMDNNQLVSVPEGLGYLPVLEKIEARNNKLISLPIDLCQSKSIEILLIAENPIRMPPPEIVDQGLRQINDFLARMFRCQAKSTLDLRALNLESIDYEILPIPDIKHTLYLAATGCFTDAATSTLDLRALNLESIDYEILPIPDIKRLLLSNNRMKTLADKQESGKKSARVVERTLPCVLPLSVEKSSLSVGGAAVISAVRITLW